MTTAFGISLRDRWKTAAPTMMIASPAAATGVSQGSIPVNLGRVRPGAARISAT